MSSENRTVVASFTSLEDARQALEDLDGRESGVHRGSVLMRDLGGTVYVRELDERSLGDIARNGLDLGVFVLAGGVGILVDALFSSANLLLRSTSRAADLAGSVVKAPVRRVRGLFRSDADLQRIGGELAPGGSAIVVEVEADKSAEVAAKLVARGGAVDVTLE